MAICSAPNSVLENNICKDFKDIPVWEFVGKLYVTCYMQKNYFVSKSSEVSIAEFNFWNGVLGI